MKLASSATLLLAAALSTLSAAQTIITQASAKPMIVKPGGLVTLSLEMVFSEDTPRKLEDGNSTTFVGVQVYPEDYIEVGPSTFNKDGTKGDKTKNGKPDKVARPGKDLLENDGIIFHSASIKPNAFRPKVVADTESFESEGIVAFGLPTDEIKLLKKYTAIFKFRLSKDWYSGDIVPFAVGTDINGPTLVNVIVR